MVSLVFCKLNLHFIEGGIGDREGLDIAVKCSQIPTNGNMWTQVGSLMKPRRGHRSVAIGDSIMHIGGYVWLLNMFFSLYERWTLNGTEFIKEELPATLDYITHPVLFLVSSDFCF